MKTFHEFSTANEARTYCRNHGTGGWIFEDDATGNAVLFPPCMAPTAIMHHALCKGKSGNLIGHG